MAKPERTGAWLYPPRKRPYLERHGRKWIAATFIFILVVVFASHVAGKAIAQAAYDAVNFETYLN